MPVPSRQADVEQQPGGEEGAKLRRCLKMDKKVYDEPSEVTATDGSVFLFGPDGVDVGMSAEAAEETSDRLLQNAMLARGQRHFEDAKKPRKR